MTSGLNPGFHPSLTPRRVGDITLYVDEALERDCGIVVAFSERGGGVSEPPFESLNLGLHVGDDPRSVEANRRRVLAAAGLGEAEIGRLVSAHQVHGTDVLFVDELGDIPVSPAEATDALATLVRDVPLMLCFADCVPVVLVVPGSPGAVAVVHSGWRGTLADITGKTLSEMVDRYGVNPADVLAYIGPYIGPNNFEVGPDVWGLFEANFGKLTPMFTADGAVRFDLADAVRESLSTLGVLGCHIASMGVCTVESVDRFFSYRAEGGTTGRLGALACIR